MNIQININKAANNYSGSGGEASAATQTSLTDTTTPKANTSTQTSLDDSVSQYPGSPIGSKNNSSDNKIIKTAVDTTPKETTWDKKQELADSEQKFSFEKGMVDMFTSFMSSFKEMMAEYMSQIKELVSGIMEAFKGAQPQKPEPTKEEPANTTGRPVKSFADRVPEILSGHKSIGHINEADLQGAVITYQLHQKSEDAELFFMQKLAEIEKTKSNKSEAVKAALIATQEAGKISKHEAEFVYSLSHRAAQVDEKHDEVSNAQHGAGTMDLAHAIKGAEINLAQVVQGKLIIEPKPLY